MSIVFLAAPNELASGGTPADPPPNYVRAWRQHRRLTQQALADLAMCSAARISQIENGEESNTSLLRQLARALQVEVGWLLSVDPNDEAWRLVDAIKEHPDIAQVRRVVEAMTRDQPCSAAQPARRQRRRRRE